MYALNTSVLYNQLDTSVKKVKHSEQNMKNKDMLTFQKGQVTNMLLAL